MYRNPVCSWALYTKIQYPLTRMLLSISYWILVYTSCRSWASLIWVHVWACLWVYLIVVSHEHAHIDIQYMYQNPVCSWAPSYIYWNTVSAWECPYENVTGFWYIYEHVHEIPKGGMRTLIYVHCTKIQYAHGHHPIYQMMQYPYELACSWVCYSILVHICSVLMCTQDFCTYMSVLIWAYLLLYLISTVIHVPNSSMLMGTLRGAP
jgi:hypothetical protein